MLRRVFEREKKCAQNSGDSFLSLRTEDKCVEVSVEPAESGGKPLRWPPNHTQGSAGSASARRVRGDKVEEKDG